MRVCLWVGGDLGSFVKTCSASPSPPPSPPKKHPARPRSYLPKEEAAANPFLALAATKRGGHLGFLQGVWPLGLSYSDLAVDDWMAAALAVAGAVERNRCPMTNISWVIDGDALGRRFGFE